VLSRGIRFILPLHESTSILYLIELAVLSRRNDFSPIFRKPRRCADAEQHTESAELCPILAPAIRAPNLLIFANARDVLTPQEIMAFLKELSDPLRMMIELDAFSGLRRGGIDRTSMAGRRFREPNPASPPISCSDGGGRA